MPHQDTSLAIQQAIYRSQITRVILNLFVRTGNDYSLAVKSTDYGVILLTQVYFLIHIRIGSLKVIVNNHNMGMREIFIYTNMEWVNCNTEFA